MYSPRATALRILRAALVAAALAPVVRADDDIVNEDELTPPAQNPAPNQVHVQMFGGAGVGGARVIVMPGLRLQVGGPGQANAAAQGAAAPENGPKEPYLGVVLGPVSPAVRAQLDLPEGVGLSIDGVAEGGPAAKAGVRQFDVIHKFNDQVVCSIEQLTTLVKVAGAGTKVPLKLVRGGRETGVEAVLEERVAVPEADGGAIMQALPGVLNLQQMIPQGAAELAPNVQADIEKRFAEELARRVAGGGVMPGLAPGMVPGAALGNLRAQVLMVGPNAQSATVVSDARGTVELRTADGAKTVIVKDPQGKELYSGPLDTAEDLEKVPEACRDWVREIDAGRQVVRPIAPDAAEPEAVGASTGPTT